MTKFRKKPVVIEATQWWKNGDHEAVTEQVYDPRSRGAVEMALSICKHCNKYIAQHGWIDTKEGARIVCPGDWIISGVQGRRYPCKPDIFEATYEPVEESAADGEVRG